MAKNVRKDLQGKIINIFTSIRDVNFEIFIKIKRDKKNNKRKFNEFHSFRSWREMIINLYLNSLIYLMNE